MKRLLFFSIIIYFATVGFSQNSLRRNISSLGSIPTYDLSDHWNSNEFVNLSAIAESIEYIPLETNSNSMSNLDDALRISMSVSENYMVFCNLDKNICLFDSKGRFISVIGRTGKGPGEYTSVKGLKISADEKSIWILDSGQNRLINYTSDNRWINTIKINSNGFYFEIFDDKIYLVCISYPNRQEDSNLIEVMDMSGNIIKSIPLYQDRLIGPGRVIGFTTRISMINDQLVNFETPYDTVFKLDKNDKWKPIAAFIHGPNQIPRKVYDNNTYNKDFHDYATVKKTIENTNFYFIDGGYKQNMSRIFVDKENSTVSRCNYIIRDISFGWAYAGFKNDIDGLMTFWPKEIFRDKYLYSIVDSYIIIECAQKNHISLKEPLNDLTENSNPVVMVVKLK